MVTNNITDANPTLINRSQMLNFIYYHKEVGNSQEQVN